jgi:hypothetical protein
VPSRRLEDRIRELCHQVSVVDDDNFETVLSELRSAIHKHIQHLRKMTVLQLAGEKERRTRTLGELQTMQDSNGVRQHCGNWLTKSQPNKTTTNFGAR